MLRSLELFLELGLGKGFLVALAGTGGLFV